MPLPPLPKPPEEPITDADGKLTKEGRSYFDRMWRKLGREGEIPAESIQSNVIRNQSNNAKVEWADVDAAAGKVKVHGPGGDSVAWERYEGTDSGFRTLGPYAAQEFTGKAYNATYYVAYNPGTATVPAAYVVTTDYRQTLRNGYIWVGTCVANASFGGAGAVSGGGGSGAGGSGGAGSTGGGGTGGGFGMLL